MELLDAAHEPKRGRQAEAARKIDREPNYISRLISGLKAIGEDLQDVIEDRYGLAKGWLDMPLGTPVIARNTQAEHQDLSIQTVQEPKPSYDNVREIPANKSLDRAVAVLRTLPPEAQDEAIALIYHVAERHSKQAARAGL